jgi:hypothetical protein
MSAAISKATHTRYGVTPQIDGEQEISFYANNARPINIKPSAIYAAGKHLEKMVLKRENAQEVVRLNQAAKSATLTSGIISGATNNGWFVNLPNIIAFMPIKEAIGKEADTGLYAIGAALQFAIVSSSIRRGSKPSRVILSRRSALLARTIAERLLSRYGFIDIKRKAGVKQTILLRAFPSRELQLTYQSYFPTERIVYQKLTLDGEIKRGERRRRS